MDNNPLLDKYGKVLQDGETIFNENEDGEHMFIIQEGKVQISRKLQGKDQVIAVLEKGDFFGEMAIVNRIKRTATAKAAAPTTLLAFDRLGFQQMVEKNPKIALNIIDKLCRRLAQANSTIQNISQANHTEQILLHIYYQFIEKGSDHKSLKRHQLLEELGMNLQLSREDFELQLNFLTSRGILSGDADELVMVDRAAFQKLIKEIE